MKHVVLVKRWNDNITWLCGIGGERGRGCGVRTRGCNSRPLPCLEIAEFLGDNFADIDAEPVDDTLCQIRMGRAAEDFYVRHSALQ